MIQYIKYKYRINNLFRERAKTAKIYAEELKTLRSKKASREDVEGLYHEERTDISIIDFEIETLTTTYFINLARVKFIEVPNWEDETSWVESSLDPHKKVLSNKAISELRSKIMNYRKERIEQLVSLITALTGLAGTIIGLVALFMQTK